MPPPLNERTSCLTQAVLVNDEKLRELFQRIDTDLGGSIDQARATPPSPTRTRTCNTHMQHARATSTCTCTRHVRVHARVALTWAHPHTAPHRISPCAMPPHAMFHHSRHVQPRRDADLESPTLTYPPPTRASWARLSVQLVSLLPPRVSSACSASPTKMVTATLIIPSARLHRSYTACTPTARLSSLLPRVHLELGARTPATWHIDMPRVSHGVVGREGTSPHLLRL